MDSQNDPDLVIDSEGICNHCRNFDMAYGKLLKEGEGKTVFARRIREIKEAGRGKQYDCIIGLSGGVDSTYLCYIAKQEGLRPLLVHFDNGWNSELSVKNIESVVKTTGFDLYTLVIDWDEMKDIQLAFFKAGVVDLELPYDYALITTAYKVAMKYHIRHVLTGHNIVTEGTYLPKSWRHDKMDIRNIRAIHRKFGTRPMRTFPKYSFLRQRIIDRKLKYLYPLNYISYNKAKIKELIAKEFGWRDYGGKHYENIFTRFYQGYILKEKFHIDKRQFHLSILVQAGQITREEALREYEKPAYDKSLLEVDRIYVMKKLGFDEASFESYMKAPIHRHMEYPSVQTYWKIYFKIIDFLRPAKQILRKLKLAT